MLLKADRAIRVLPVLSFVLMARSRLFRVVSLPSLPFSSHSSQTMLPSPFSSRDLGDRVHFFASLLKSSAVGSASRVSVRLAFTVTLMRALNL